MYKIQNTGWIEAITGSMYCGKSEELIRRIRRAKIARQEVQVFKPMIDNRYHKANVVSHNGEQVEAISIDHPDQILERLNPDIDVVAIDEIQFFDDRIVDICEQMANDGIRVIVAGLDRDFRGEAFGPMPKLLTYAEYIDKLHAICIKCGNPASRTQRLINGEPAQYNEPVILVGAKEVYEARCRGCHEVPGKGED